MKEEALIRFDLAALALAILVLRQGECVGEGANKIHIAGSLKKMSGETSYRIRFSQYSPELSTVIIGESKLDFPLDVYLAGVDARREWGVEGGKWSLNFAMYKNVNSRADGSMRDSDWLEVPAYGARVQISDTESDAYVKAFTLEVGSIFELLKRGRLSFDGTLGYRYEYFSFEVEGVRGWQETRIGRVYFDLYRGVNVLDYDVNYSLPYAGLLLEFAFHKDWTFQARGAFSPAAYAWDSDDHILRNKFSTGKTYGTAFIGGADISCVLLGSRDAPNLFLAFEVDKMTVKTKGEQEQEWYGDDPGGAENETGMRVSGIEDHITSDQFTIRALAGYRF